MSNEFAIPMSPTSSYISNYKNKNKYSLTEDIRLSKSQPFFLESSPLELKILTNPSSLIYYNTPIIINKHKINYVTKYTGNYCSLFQLIVENNIISCEKELTYCSYQDDNTDFLDLCKRIREKKITQLSDKYYSINGPCNKNMNLLLFNINNIDDIDKIKSDINLKIDVIYFNDKDSYYSMYINLLYLLYNLKKTGTIIINTDKSLYYNEIFEEILYIYGNFFEENIFYKPVISNYHNINKYIILKGFLGITNYEFSTLRIIANKWYNIKSDNVKLCKLPKRCYYLKWLRRAEEDIYDICQKKIDKAKSIEKTIFNDTKKIINRNIDFCLNICYTNGFPINDYYQSDSYVMNNHRLIRHFFPEEKNVIMKNIQISNEGIYSISKPKDAEVISKIIIKSVEQKSNSLIITDATANIGGNTLNFSKYFKQVNAVEISPLQCSILKNNIKVYNRNNIKVYCDDYTDILDKLNQDILFIDPPWGGIRYKNEEKIDLYLSGVSIAEIINKIDNNFKIALVKVPLNFDLQKFTKNIKSRIIIIYKIRNYIILVIKNTIK
jgi:16S rRNA G966 N2-methylase RsmD